MDAPLRDRLRALSSFPESLPFFDAQSAPADAAELFRQWLNDAIDAGLTAPHAVSFATAGPTGHVTSRILILKDLVDGRWVVAGARSTRKGLDLAANPQAAMTFWWPELGRQVRVVGEVEELSSEVAAADWAARPEVTTPANPDWAAWALEASEVEFWQARHDRQHVRLRYRAGEATPHLV